MSEHRKERLIGNIVSFIMVVVIVCCIFVFNIEIGFNAFEGIGSKVSFMFINSLILIIIIVLVIILGYYKIKKYNQKKEE